MMKPIYGWRLPLNNMNLWNGHAHPPHLKVLTFLQLKKLPNSNVFGRLIIINGFVNKYRIVYYKIIISVISK
jgi:hypothetical protein